MAGLQSDFGKPIQSELFLTMNLLELDPRSSTDMQTIGLLAKEGWKKAQLTEYHSQRQALNRFALGALLLEEPVLKIICRELRKLAPGVRITIDEIKAVLKEDVMKRDVLEGDTAVEARKVVSRSAKRKRPSRDPRLPAPGTLLTRTFEGRDIAVKVFDKGFEFEAEHFKSISGVARKITGRSTNGFQFFGL